VAVDAQDCKPAFCRKPQQIFLLIMMTAMISHMQYAIDQAVTLIRIFSQAALMAFALFFVCAPAKAQRMNCEELPAAYERLDSIYGKWDMPIAAVKLRDAIGPAAEVPTNRLDRTLLRTAVISYRQHHCRGDYGAGNANIVIVDFAKPSAQPRLYIINLLTGSGIDNPISVAHGIGSDPDDNGVADYFGNMQDSLMSSLGAARGAELYSGMNGLSLRLDGLEPSNNAMRRRDIVAHSYAPNHRRYFNASLVAVRGGKPGSSEGCFVVAPEYRDWLFGVLANGGFMYAGLGGERYREMMHFPRPEPMPVASNDSATTPAEMGSQ
jgi:hypothetical protein